MKRLLLFLIPFIVGLGAFLSPAPAQQFTWEHPLTRFNSHTKEKRNILLIIADDLGVDCVAAYGEHPDPGRTPIIDALAEHGLLFRNAWSCPVCSPTRASLLTGRHPFRTGIGCSVDYEIADFELSVNEITIPKILKPYYRTAAVGKWHLSTKSGSGLMHPILCGFEHHRGTITNLPKNGGETAYFMYEKAVDGVSERSEVYATTDTVDDALELIESFQDEPWFIWMSFNAAHSPYHKPPDGLHSFNLPPNVNDDIPMHMRAMAEAMDTEIGRLIFSMDPAVLEKTIIIFVGDNGTAPAATTPPSIPSHSKGSLFEGGVNVPLIIAGSGIVQGNECSALVSVTDIFATIAEIADVTYIGAEDSFSLVPYFKNPCTAPVRAWTYSEAFKPNGIFESYFNRLRTARERRYKLMYFYDPYSPTVTDIMFFDLLMDPFELNDLTQGILTPKELEKFIQLTQVMYENER